MGPRGSQDLRSPPPIMAPDLNQIRTIYTSVNSRTLQSNQVKRTPQDCINELII